MAKKKSKKQVKCPHCPRRLNTAGGLAVHVDQVHKLGVDKIENAMPGRDTFDVEIYGMEGIPAADLAAWKKKQAEEHGVDGQENKPKRAKWPSTPLSRQDLKQQLAIHKALMTGQPLPVPPPPAQGMLNGAPMPPPHMPFGSAPPNMPMPPPGFMPPPGMPFPPPGMSFPPGMPPPPGMPFPPPPGVLPLGMPPPPGAFSSPFPGAPVPAQIAPGSSPLPPSLPGGVPAPPPTGANVASGLNTPPRIIEKMPSSAVTPKAGTLLVYGDNEVSMEEKRAQLAQYRLDDEPAAPGSVAAASTDGIAASGPATTEDESTLGRKRARAADLI
ncbi:hypothetical protein OIV83_001702 [Microbotryomycetes sp. JL201]|nr:hypothetical protein OIV83_001702 [Microbotryomycetes sp. JL201]